MAKIAATDRLSALQEKAEGQPFIIAWARYSKGMVSVRCIPKRNDGYKERADFLCDYFSRDRFSHRERAYIMSLPAAEKMVDHYIKGWDAGRMSRELIPPKDRE